MNKRNRKIKYFGTHITCLGIDLFLFTHYALFLVMKRGREKNKCLLFIRNFLCNIDSGHSTMWSNEVKEKVFKIRSRNWKKEKEETQSLIALFVLIIPIWKANFYSCQTQFQRANTLFTTYQDVFLDEIRPFYFCYFWNKWKQERSRTQAVSPILYFVSLLMRSRANYINLSKLPVQFNANSQMVFMMNEKKRLHMFTKFVIFFS